MSIIGERGQQPGELTIPGDCVIDPGDRLFVVGMANEMVSAFDLAGEFLFEFGGIGEADPFFRESAGIAVDRDGQILVADSSRGAVLVFSRDGDFQFSFGDEGAVEDRLMSPVDLAPHGFTIGIVVLDSGLHHMCGIIGNGGFTFGGFGVGSSQFRFPPPEPKTVAVIPRVRSSTALRMRPRVSEGFHFPRSAPRIASTLLVLSDLSFSRRSVMRSKAASRRSRAAADRRTGVAFSSISSVSRPGLR